MNPTLSTQALLRLYKRLTAETSAAPEELLTDLAFSGVIPELSWCESCRIFAAWLVMAKQHCLWGMRKVENTY